jgi:hypothetical protein
MRIFRSRNLLRIAATSSAGRATARALGRRGSVLRLSVVARLGSGWGNEPAPVRHTVVRAITQLGVDLIGHAAAGPS